MSTHTHQRRWRVLVGAAAVLALPFVGIATASAAPADWSANGESEIISETAVKLQGSDTSVETGNLNINVDEGDVISYGYELVDDAVCVAGAPRVFVQVNGTLSKSEHCDGTGDPATGGTISFAVANAGLITGAGLVYDSGNGGHVIVSDLTINGDLIEFATEVTPDAPTITPATCEVPEATLTVPDIEGVGYDRDGGPVEPGQITITAAPDQGYLFPDGATTEWTLTAGEPPTAQECEPSDEPGPTPDPGPDPKPAPEPKQGVESSGCDAYVDSAAWCAPTVSDYNCDDIDDSHKPVELVDADDDPFRLDADDDGRGCELPSNDDDGSGDAGGSGDGDTTGDTTGDTAGGAVGGDAAPLPDTGATTNWLITAVGAVMLMAGGVLMRTRRGGPMVS